MPWPLQESKCYQANHFESFKAITLSYVGILGVYKTTSSGNTRNKDYRNSSKTIIYIYIYREREREREIEATTRRQCHKLYGLVSNPSK